MTSTDLLMKAMEKFGDSEPVACLIIWTDINGDIQFASNSPMSHIMGMCEYAKLATFQTMEIKP
jgi:hypothetical protein